MLKQAIVIAALALAAPAWAGKPVDERRALAPDGAVSVNNLAGLIEVIGWDRDEVHITGELGADVEALEIDGDARKLSVHVRYPRKSRSVDETVLRLQVPAGAQIELKGVSASLHASGVGGTLTATTVSGAIRVVAAPALLRLNTVSGDIHARGATADAELRTVSGDIDAAGLSGQLKGETVSGDLLLAGGPFSAVVAETVSGDLTLELGLESAGTLRAATLSGDIALRLADAANARISMKTFSGRLRNALTPVSTGDKRSLDYTVGSGSTRVELSSFSGNIQIRP
jgi:DUF4097 and DUF4098 domain-containing protein YvlB